MLNNLRTIKSNLVKYGSLVTLLLLLAVTCGMCDSLSTDTTTPVDTTEVASTAADTESSSTEDAFVYPMPPERKAKLIEYSSFVNIWRFVNFFIGLGITALILLTGFSAKMRNWAKAARMKFFVVWLFFIIYLLADYLLNLPFSIYRSFIVESDFGFMNQTFMEWWGDDLLGLLLAALFGIIPVWFLYLVIEKFKNWWLVFTVGAIPFVVLMMIVVPIFIAPLFNEFKPLEDKHLESELISLADRAGIGEADLFQVDGSKQSTKINAYVTGMFGSKRIVLYDTMIDNFTTEEIKFVMGHEMGHYIMQHIWWGLGVALIFIGFALWLISRTIHPVIRKFSRQFGFDNLADIASLPLIMVFLTILSFLFQPVTNSSSRVMERMSDKYGMDISEVSGEVAATAFDKLSVYNLSDPDPHPIIEFWFYSHPALKKRMEFVRGYRP